MRVYVVGMLDAVMYNSCSTGMKRVLVIFILEL